MTGSDTPIPPIHLPAGYTARPVTLADAEAAADLENAHHSALTGRPGIEAGDIRSDWSQPTMNLATNTLAVVAADGSFAGIAELWDSAPHVHNYVFAVVHPAHQGRGIGAALAGWAEARGRQLLPAAPADARVILRQFKMRDDTAAAALLRQQGYALARHNLRMMIDFTQPPPRPIPPDGLVIRPFVRGPEDHALITAVREEFRDHWGEVETPYEQDYAEWQHWMDTGPTCDPSLFFVAMDGAEVAGTALCQAKWAEDPESGWIFGLGVRRPWRRRGVALALLQHCFWALHGRGKRRARLGVDAESLTGATRLYEKAGMTLERQFDFYELELRGGKDLGTQVVK
jgi:ribosomal protein S18 acetylase RimI-like enzyme